MLRSLAGWILLATLIAAPWALASIDDWAKAALGAAGLLAALPWTLHYIRIRKRPPIPPLCAAAVAALLALGWWMTLNARSVYRFPTHKYMSVQPLWDAAPGAVERFTAAEWLWPITGIFALLLIACDLSADSPWRRRIWLTMTATGLSIAAYGILEKLEILPPLTTHYAHEASVFGPFDYHGNAGAYLNVILSLLIAVVWHLITTKNPIPAPKTQLLPQNTPLILALTALPLISLFVNISRGAVLIMALQFLLFIVWALWRRSRRGEGQRGHGRAIAVAAGVTVLVVTVAAIALYADPRGAGLGEYLARGANSGRVLAWRVAWGMSTDAPWFGSGPGSFKLLFSHTPHWIFALYSRWVITTHIPGNRVSEWSYACQDYLQLLVEWGWVGITLWAILIGGGLFSALRALCRAPADRQWLLAAILVALAGICAHALFDYPLQIPSLQLYVGVLVGMAWGAPRWNPQTSPSLSRNDPLRSKRASRIVF